MYALKPVFAVPADLQITCSMYKLKNLHEQPVAAAHGSDLVSCYLRGGFRPVRPDSRDPQASRPTPSWYYYVVETSPDRRRPPIAWPTASVNVFWSDLGVHGSRLDDGPSPERSRDF